MTFEMHPKGTARLLADIERARERCGWCGGPVRPGERYCCPACEQEAHEVPAEDYGGVLGADGRVYSDADPGL